MYLLHSSNIRNKKIVLHITFPFLNSFDLVLGYEFSKKFERQILLLVSHALPDFRQVSAAAFQENKPNY